MLLHLYRMCAFVLPLLAVTSTLSCRAQNMDFTWSKTGTDLLLDGDCSVAPEGYLGLTANATGIASQHAVSRAVYNSKVQFYDSGTGAEASFNVSFTFRMQAVGNNKMGDGMTFIIAPDQFAPPWTGSVLGLYDAGKFPQGSSELHVLAVEFDTANNTSWDPPGDGNNHVGLDINNIDSTITGNLTGLGIDLHNTASPFYLYWIDYSADRQELVVSLAVGEGSQKSDARVVLSYSSLNVSSIVQAKSYVGFTADTGRDYIQDTYVYDWSFSTSGLQSQTPPSAVPQASSQPEPHAQAGKKSNTGLVAGAAIGATAFMVVALGCGLCWWFRCRSGGSSGKNGLEGSPANWMTVPMVATSSTTGRGSEKSGTSSLGDADMSYAYGTRTFTYQELKMATEGFSESLILGKGGFGVVYRGVIRMGGSEVELASKESRRIPGRERRSSLSKH